LGFLLVSYCKKSHILVVDDIPDNIFILQTILELEGYMVDTALSGRSALSKIQASPPDLILLDIMMPGMNGWEVIQHIRQNHNLPFIPILVVTAIDEINATQGLKAGADDCIRKPFDNDELLVRVKAFFAT
jgi:CheY-like chemotaxis protein